MAVRATRKGRPAVLFIDDSGWDCFFQLAAGIKKAGIRTVRITRSSQSRATSRLFFDRTLHLGGDVSDPIDLPGILEGEHIIDVQTTEAMAVAAGKAFTLLPPSRRTEAWNQRAAGTDKLLVSQRLREVGLDVPRVLSGLDADAGRIVRELGLPVVRKLRVGSGGEGISIVDTREELDALLAEEPPSDRYFFEQFIEGAELQIGGVFGGRENVVVTYETLQRRGAHQPACRIRVIDDPGLEETGRAVAEALGISGFMNVNLIRDADGREWIHDVNPRVFGSFMAFRRVGVDFQRAYLNWLFDASRRGPCLATDGSSITVFPAAYREELQVGRPGAIAGFLRVAYPYVRWAGLRYVAYELGRQLLHEIEHRPDPNQGAAVGHNFRWVRKGEGSEGLGVLQPRHR